MAQTQDKKELTKEIRKVRERDVNADSLGTDKDVKAKPLLALQKDLTDMTDRLKKQEDSLKKQEDNLEKVNNLMFLGFFILILMVAGLLTVYLQQTFMSYNDLSGKVTELNTILTSHHR